MGKYIDDKDIIKYLNSVVVKMDKEIERFIPEDTFDLQNDRKIDFAKREWSKIVASVFIDPNWPSSEYAEYVHWGVPSQQTRNYYKNSGRRNGWSPFLTSSSGTQFMIKGLNYVKDNNLI